MSQQKRERVECPGEECEQKHLAKKIKKSDEYNNCPNCGTEFPDDFLDEDDDTSLFLLLLGAVAAVVSYLGWEVSKIVGMVGLGL